MMKVCFRASSRVCANGLSAHFPALAVNSQREVCFYKVLTLRK